MKISLNVVKLGALAAIAAIVIAVAVFYAQTGKVVMESGNAATNAVTNTMSEKVYTSYNGSIVNGSTVRYVVELYDSSDFIRVVTMECKTGITEFSEMKDASSTNFIDPSDVFTAQVYYNKNNYPVGICFREQGVVITKFSNDEAGNKLRSQFVKETSDTNRYARDTDAYVKWLNTQVQQLEEKLALQEGEYNHLAGVDVIQNEVTNDSLQEFAEVNDAKRQQVQVLEQELARLTKKADSLYSEMERQVLEALSQ